jgi:hypothetical protein
MTALAARKFTRLRHFAIPLRIAPIFGPDAAGFKRNPSPVWKSLTAPAGRPMMPVRS